MYCNFFLISALVISLTFAHNQLLIFTQDEDALSKCIEDYLLNGNDPYYQAFGIAKKIAKVYAKRFSGKTKTKKDFRKDANNVFFYLKYKRSFWFKNNQTHQPLLHTMKAALISCIQNVYDHLLATPIFEGEIHEIGIVLNYILVDWPKPLFNMIRNRNDRVVLRRYSEDAMTKLAFALNSVMDHDYFRYLLRSYWMLRAQYLFNGHDSQVPYLRHRYTMELPYPHTYDNWTEFTYRNAYQFSDRNPQASKDNFNRIMEIHTANRPGYGEYDVFSAYERRGGISSAEYYIETHIDQFYRIIFFFMELQSHGIWSDKEDIYDERLPFDLIPVPLQRIVYNHLAYRYYLLSLRVQLETTMINNPEYHIDIGQSLLSARVREEDLISLRSIWIQHNYFASTTTTRPTSSTISNSNPMKKKGSVWLNKNGKHFCNQPQAKFSRVKQPQQMEDCTVPENSSTDNFHQLDLLEESVFFKNTLDNVMTSFSYPTTSNHERL